MILSHFFKNFLKLFLFVYIFTSYTYAESIEDKVKNLTLELRCMTCQNQSIHDSDAEFSNDIRKIVKRKFIEGRSEYEIKTFLVERYGEYILFRPLIDFKNLFLWAFPFILLVIGSFFLIFKTRKK